MDSQQSGSVLAKHRSGTPFGPAEESLKILYLTSTFPILSETAVQREIRVLRELPVELTVYSLWRGDAEFEGQTIHRFPAWNYLTLIWWIPFWLWRKPKVLGRLLKSACEQRPRSLMHLQMTFVGVAFALCIASRLSRRANRPDVIHAAWATMPASGAQLLSAILQVPFSFQVHAYDMFKHGGDWLLPSKLRDTALVITSTEYARAALIGRGVNESRVVMIRTGLDVMPARKPQRPNRNPFRILSVGRLVEKKGYFEQLDILASLNATGFEFEARIIGGGPCEAALRNKLQSLDLADLVTLMGPRSNEFVQEQFRWADVLLFAGKVAADGDRDGLPNVIGEAMAIGVPVVSTPVAGVPEAIENGETGTLICGNNSEPWRKALIRLRDDDRFYADICRNARAWAQTHFDAQINTRQIFHALELLVNSGFVPGAPAD